MEEKGKRATTVVRGRGGRGERGKGVPNPGSLLNNEKIYNITNNVTVRKL